MRGPIKKNSDRFWWIKAFEPVWWFAALVILGWLGSKYLPSLLK